MNTDIVIIGAGITGLSCAYHLKRDHILFEKELVPGGICRTDTVNGFSFDRAEHFIRAPNKKVLEFFKEILGDDFFRQKLISSIYYDRRFVPYPFQKNIYYLSDKDKLNCFKSFIRRKNDSRGKKARSFGEWALANYGEWVTDVFIGPYNKKIWQISPFKMRSDFSFDPGLIPRISFDEMLEYIFLSQNERKEKNIQYRYYSKKGGIGSISKKLASKVRNIRLGTGIAQIDLKGKKVICSNGTVCHYNKLISTVPLPELIKMIKDIPGPLKDDSKSLKHSSICVFNLALKKELSFPQHWIYFPESYVPFARAYFLKNFNSKMCPQGKSSISIVHTFLPNKKINFSIVEKKIINYLSENNFFSKDDIDFKFRQMIRYGMPTPTIGSDKIVKRLDDFLVSHSVKTIGRYGLWKYEGMEHAVQDGQNINTTLKALKL